MALNKYYLGDLITQRREKNPGGDLPIRGVSKEGLQPPKQIDADTSIYNLYYRNDFVFNPARMELGSIAFNNEYDKAICSSLYEVFYVHRTDLVIPEYLALFVKHPEFARYCNYIGNGSAREYCRFDNISGIPIYLPPIAEQRKIVHDYQVITDRIELLRKMNVNLSEQCGNNYAAMLNGFTEEDDLGVLPEGWSVGNIGSYCDLKSGYAFKSEWWTDNGVKVIKIANISENAIDLDSCDSVTEEHAQLASLFFSYPGDIFIAMTGATTGKMGILPYCKEKVVVNQRVGKFFLGENPVLKAPFLYATLLYPRVIRHLQPGGMAGSAQDNLSADDIKNVKIVMPDEKSIMDFNTKNRCIIECIMRNLSEVRVLQNLASLLLSRMQYEKGA